MSLNTFNFKMHNVYLLAANIVLFLLMGRAGVIKYIFVLGMIGMLSLCMNKRIKDIDKLYFFLPWLFYIFAGWGFCVVQDSVNANSYKQTIFYLIPITLAFVISTYLKKYLRDLVDIQFLAILLVFLLTGIQNFTKSDLMESQYAFIFGAYLLYYFWNKQYCLSVVSVIALYLANKRIALLAAVLTVCYLIFLNVLKKEKAQLLILRVSNILILGGVFAYIYIIKSGILGRITAKYKINTMGRTNVYGMISEAYTFSLKYLGKGIGSVQVLVRELGISTYQLLHNDILSFYIEIGFVGFLIFWTIYCTIFILLLKRVSTQTMCIVFGLFVFTVIVFMTDNISIYINYFYPFYVMIFSLLERDREMLERNQDGKKRYIDDRCGFFVC